ncbi:response regulator [Deinococcus sp. KSM4-11]|uniref:response regulator n=1 Tax=Deinococcus sp. KSM4-11 TaxID=2568654 RepID=UPI0010A345D1|nr:response regulator [Deinococcus sp. KSM4-11]THF84376.1 response regulator [Deinococcus sp. KSM4-11]
MPDADSHPRVAIQSRVLKVLLVEDDASAAELMEDVFAPHTDSVQLDIIPNADQLFTLLQTPGSSLPDAVLLNLHLEGRPALEVLADLKRDPVLRRLPVVVLSGTDDPTEVARAYQGHASAVLVKSSGMDVLQARINAFVDFWRYSRLPG